MFARAGLRTLVSRATQETYSWVIADVQSALPRAQVARTNAAIAQRRALSDQARKLIDNVSTRREQGGV